MKQLTLFPMPEPEYKASPEAIRLTRRTRLAFRRLVRLVEAQELEVSEWLLYVVRRTDQELGTFRTKVDPRIQYRIEERARQRAANPTEKKRKVASYRMPGNIRKKIREWLVENSEGIPRCAYCNKFLKEITLDHLKPIADGGTHQAPNICLACPQCNGVKGNRTPEQWADDILSARQKTAALQRTAVIG